MNGLVKRPARFLRAPVGRGRKFYTKGAKRQKRVEEREPEEAGGGRKFYTKGVKRRKCVEGKELEGAGGKKVNKYMKKH